MSRFLTICFRLSLNIYITPPLSIQASCTTSTTPNASNGTSIESMRSIQTPSPLTSVTPLSPAEHAYASPHADSGPASYEESDAALAAMLLQVGVQTRSGKKRAIEDAHGTDYIVAGPSKKAATRSSRAEVQCRSRRPPAKKAEASPPQPGPSRIVSKASATTSTLQPQISKPSIREGFTINSDGAMENDDAVELPPLGGTCHYKLSGKDGTVVDCNKTFEGGFAQKQMIHDHFAAHVAEMVNRRDARGGGTTKCFQCDNVQGLQTMVRHIETTHFGVQRWDCKHCDNSTKKTRMDKSTIQRHLAGCLKKVKVDNTIIAEEKGKQVKKRLGKKK